MGLWESVSFQIYDSPEADLKLNDVFEFIGVFTFDPELEVHNYDSDEFSNDALVHLPPSKVVILSFKHRAHMWNAYEYLGIPSWKMEKKKEKTYTEYESRMCCTRTAA